VKVLGFMGSEMLREGRSLFLGNFGEGLKEGMVGIHRGSPKGKWEEGQAR
jgi:hypothetical protein